MENTSQHEQIVTLQSQYSRSSSSSEALQNEPPRAPQVVQNLVAGAIQKLQKGGNNPYSDEQQDLIKHLEQRVSDLQLIAQKQERDIAYKDEEIRSVKNIAREVAEKLDPYQKKQQEFEMLMDAKHQELFDKDMELNQHRTTISELKAQLDDAGRESNKMVDLRLQFEGKLDRKESEIQMLKEDNLRLRDTIKGKDDAIHALSLTLIEKGEHNKRLMEKMSEMKNHQLKHHFLNQPILTQKLSKKMGGVPIEYIFKFVTDKTEEYHFFLEIKEKREQDGGGLLKKKKLPLQSQRINVVDIECIEPVQRSSNFILYYYEHIQEQSGGLFGGGAKKKKHVLREEHFQSRHVGEILYAYQQILEAMEEEEHDLGIVHQNSNSSDLPISSSSSIKISEKQTSQTFNSPQLDDRSTHVLPSHSQPMLIQSKSHLSSSPGGAAAIPKQAKKSADQKKGGSKVKNGALDYEKASSSSDSSESDDDSSDG